MKGRKSQVTQTAAPGRLSAAAVDALRLKVVGNIVAKIRAGKTPTAQEQAILDAARAEPDAGPAVAEWVPNRARLAEVLGCHENSIPRWLKEHRADPARKQLKNSRGEYNVPAWRAFITRHALQPEAALDPALVDIKLKQEIEKLHRLKRENQVADGRYITLAAAARIFEDSHARVKALAREIFEEQLPPQCEGLKAAAIRVVNRGANDRLCVAMQDHARQLQALATVTPV